MPIIDEHYQLKLKPRADRSHKGDFGRVLIIAGCLEMGGAGLMAAKSCLYSGAGLVTLATHPENILALHVRTPEVMALDYGNREALEHAIQGADTILIGPGLGLNLQAEDLFRFTLAHVQPSQQLVIDADALTLLAKDVRQIDPASCAAGSIVLTPHAKEWERVSSIAIEQQTDSENQHSCHCLFSDRVYVLVKSEETRLYHDLDPVSHLKLGNPGMAIGGMGDTLAGMVTALVSQKTYSSIREALEDALFLHSYIADVIAKEQFIVLPDRLSELIPKTIRHLLNQVSL